MGKSEACEHPFVRHNTVCSKCKLLVRYDGCVECAVDVPLSKAHTMAVWAELQLRADNPMTAQTEAIQEAARLFRRAEADDEGHQVSTVDWQTWRDITAWLSRDIVKVSEGK